MMSSIGSASSTSAYLSRMLSRLDTDSSGSISKDEFVAVRDKGTSEDQSSKLNDPLDSTGSLSLTDMYSAFQQMSSLMQATLLQAQEGAAGGRGQEHGGPDSYEMVSNQVDEI